LAKEKDTGIQCLKGLERTRKRAGRCNKVKVDKRNWSLTGGKRGRRNPVVVEFRLGERGPNSHSSREFATYIRMRGSAKGANGKKKWLSVGLGPCPGWSQNHGWVAEDQGKEYLGSFDQGAGVG